MTFAVRAQHDGENVWVNEAQDGTVVGTADPMIAPDGALTTDSRELAESIAATKSGALTFYVVDVTPDFVVDVTPDFVDSRGIE